MPRYTTSEALCLANEATTPSPILEEIWDTSRSVKVRKAIALNPNSSPDLLRRASRLYLEEVLQNDSFELMVLFSAGDEWVEQISQAYNDPEAFLYDSRVIRNRRYDPTNHSTERAVLLSPKLTPRALSETLQWISKDALRRAFKHKDTWNNAKKAYNGLIKGGCAYQIDLNSVCVLHSLGFLTDEEVIEYLDNTPSRSLFSSGYNCSAFYRKIYTRWCLAYAKREKLLSAEADQEMRTTSTLLALFIQKISSEGSRFINEIYEPEVDSDIRGLLYLDVMEKYVKLAGHSSQITAPLSSPKLKRIGTVVISHLRSYYFAESKYQEAFELIRSKGLNKTLIGYHGLKAYSQAEIDRFLSAKNLSLECKEFYIRQNFFTTRVLKVEKEVFDFMNEVNLQIWERDHDPTTLLFDKCTGGFGQVKEIIFTKAIYSA